MLLVAFSTLCARCPGGELLAERHSWHNLKIKPFGRPCLASVRGNPRVSLPALEIPDQGVLLLV